MTGGTHVSHRTPRHVPPGAGTLSPGLPPEHPQSKHRPRSEPAQRPDAAAAEGDLAPPGQPRAAHPPHCPGRRGPGSRWAGTTHPPGQRALSKDPARGTEATVTLQRHCGALSARGSPQAVWACASPTRHPHKPQQAPSGANSQETFRETCPLQRNQCPLSQGCTELAGGSHRQAGPPSCLPCSWCPLTAPPLRPPTPRAAAGWGYAAQRPVVSTRQARHKHL